MPLVDVEPPSPGDVPVKHEWVDDRPAGVAGFMMAPRRRCIHCDAVQTEERDYLWMRVSRVRWVPLVGRCKGKPADGE